MAGIRRRDFLKYCIGSADTLGLDLEVSSRLRQALAADQALPAVIWLNGTHCTGCTVSLSNLIHPTPPSNVGELLVNFVSLESDPNLETAAGDLALQTLNLNQAIAKDFILAVDGGIPPDFGGHACVLWTEKGREVTAREVLTTLASRAKAILTIGNCASFGGTPFGTPNLTGINSVGTATGRPTVNVPGCPAHPDWVVWTVAQLLANGSPFLDRNGRPADVHRTSTHENYPRNGGAKADRLGADDERLNGQGRKEPGFWEVGPALPQPGRTLMTEDPPLQN